MGPGVEDAGPSEVRGVLQDVPVISALPELDTLVSQGLVVLTLGTGQVNQGGHRVLLLLLLPRDAGDIARPVTLTGGLIEDQRARVAAPESSLASPAVHVLVAVSRPAELTRPPGTD